MTKEDMGNHRVQVLDERITRERELREKFEQLMDERDRRYEDRFSGQEEAVKAALAAQKALTDAAFASSEKAITKAEAAQTSYNERTNELRGALNDQNKTLLPRSEADSRFIGYDEKIDEIKKEIMGLRESRSAVVGKDTASESARSQAMWFKGLVVVTALALLGLLVTITLFLVKSGG